MRRCGWAVVCRGMRPNAKISPSYEQRWTGSVPFPFRCVSRRSVTATLLFNAISEAKQATLDGARRASTSPCAYPRIESSCGSYRGSGGWCACQAGLVSAPMDSTARRTSPQRHRDHGSGRPMVGKLLRRHRSTTGNSQRRRRRRCGPRRNTRLSDSDYESDYVNVPGLRPKEIERRRRLQRHFAHQNRDSIRRAETKLQLARLYQREHNRRRDAIHNITIRLATEHGLVAIERLNVGALSASAKGTVLVPGTNVAQKRGLNREIRARGWGEFRRQLQYKAVWYGIQVVEVYPANTSRRCSRCGYTALRNRKSQAVFWCRGCGWGPVNADFNAAVNIRERGIELASAPGPGVAARGAFGVGLAGKREPQTGLGQPRRQYQPQGIGR
jgi:IS605 OrfB family transposase